VDLTNMPDDFLPEISKLIEKKVEFKLTYRETKLFDHAGRVVYPETIESYVLNKYCATFNDSHCEYRLLTDTGKFDYKYIAVILHMDTDTKLKSVRLSNNTLFNGEHDFMLTQEAADLYGLNFALNDTSYVIDISQYINTTVKLFFDNKRDCIYPIHKTYEISTLFPEELNKINDDLNETQIALDKKEVNITSDSSDNYQALTLSKFSNDFSESHIALCDNYKKERDIRGNPLENRQIVILNQFKLKLTLELTNKATGSANIYLFK
jgi:hypothetical protein